MAERVPLLARVAGGRVLGPKPGVAIVSFWQGIVEIVLRSLALVMLVVVLIPAGLGIDSVTDDSTFVTNRDVAKGGCILVLLVGIIGAIVQATHIILRFVNIGLINMTFRIYGIVDIVTDAVISALLLAGAAVTGYSAHANSAVSLVATPLGATAGVCFLPILALLAQGVWMLLFVILKWNKHVVTYTLKEAVFS